MAGPDKTTILVAEDNIGHPKVLELTLSAYDYEVVPTQDGREALAYLEEGTPDLIILDVNMPFVSGLEVCDHVKSDGRLKDVPVIIITSLTDEKTERAAKAVGADLMVHKPITGRNLRGMITDLLTG